MEERKLIGVEFDEDFSEDMYSFLVKKWTESNKIPNEYFDLLMIVLNNQILLDKKISNIIELIKDQNEIGNRQNFNL